MVRPIAYRLCAFAVVISLCAVATGCGYRGNPRTAQSSAATPVAQTASAGPNSAQGLPNREVINATGIYTKSGDPMCCWLADDAVFRINTLPSATRLRAMIVVPDLPVLRHSRRTLGVIIDGKPVANFSLRFGTSTLTVPLHPGNRKSTTVEFKPGFSFVPKDEHINGDTRKLSIILKSLRAE